MGGGDPCVAYAVAVGIGGWASFKGVGSGDVGATVGALAAEVDGQGVVGDPCVAPFVLVGVGVGAAFKFLKPGDVGADVVAIIDAVPVGVFARGLVFHAKEDAVEGIFDAGADTGARPGRQMNPDGGEDLGAEQKFRRLM